MGKYFSTDDYEVTKLAKDLFSRLRVRENGEGFNVMIGGQENDKGKLTGATSLAYCETREEADKLVENLCSLA